MFCKPFSPLLAVLCQRKKNKTKEKILKFLRRLWGNKRGEAEKLFFIHKLSMFYLKRHESEPQLYFVGLQFRYGGVRCLFSAARELSSMDWWIPDCLENRIIVSINFFKAKTSNIFCLQIPRFARNLPLFVMYDGNWSCLWVLDCWLDKRSNITLTCYNLSAWNWLIMKITGR